MTGGEILRIHRSVMHTKYFYKKLKDSQTLNIHNQVNKDS